MPRKKKEVVEGITEKLEYLGLDLDKIPQNLKEFEHLEYRVSRFYDEKQYRQYRYIDVKDIQILLSPTNRLTDLDEKYKKARPLYEYLDSKNEENIIKDELEFNISQEDQTDLSKPTLYNNCANPITLSYINQNIKTDYTIIDTTNPITYDGTL